MNFLLLYPTGFPIGGTAPEVSFSSAAPSFMGLGLGLGLTGLIELDVDLDALVGRNSSVR